MSEAEMVEGYLDGRTADTPEPSANRSASYRHGFEMGRNDLLRRFTGTAAANRTKAEAAIAEDERR